MLKMQKQRRHECLPTSVAMLKGVPVQEILNLFQEVDFNHRAFGEIWSGKCEDFWPLAWEVLGLAFGPATVQAYQEVVGWNGQDCKGGLWATGGHGASLPFPQTGKGLLQLIRGRGRHTVAYSEGLVYDPEEDEAMTWSKYKERFPYYKIEGVIPTP